MRHRPTLRRTGIAGLLLALSLPAAAWNAAGHRLSAALAWQEMRPETRAAVTGLLARHPDRERWQKHNRSGDSGRTAFIEASTWPDDIRRDRRFHDDGEAPTPALPGYPDMHRRTSWHYAEQRIDDGRRVGRGELGRQLPRLLLTLADRHAPPATRVHALPWIVHLVADAHQPLHTAGRSAGDGRSDAGGNRLWVETPQHPRLRGMSLHAYWDDLPGPPWLRGKALDRAVAALPRPNLAAVTDADRLADVAGWIAESRALAGTVAYAGLSGDTPVIDDRYHDRARETARERIALAAHRLARLLDALLDEGSDVSRETGR